MTSRPHLPPQRVEFTVQPSPRQSDGQQTDPEAANQGAVGVERFIDAFLRPPMTFHASIFIRCGDYVRRVCTCGHVSGPHIDDASASAEPCPRQYADVLQRLRLGQDKDEILAGLRALVAK